MGIYISHISEIELNVTDLDSLEKACNELGLQLVRGQTEYRWYGRSSGPPPAGFTEEDLGKCEHAIVIPGDEKAYQVGVVRRRDGKPGYCLLLDEFCGGYGLIKKIGEGAGKLRQGYGVQVATSQARKQGFSVQQKRLPNGKIQLVMSR